MKALTIWQPWASLIAWEEKHYETRGWATTYRGPLAIHASLRMTREQTTACWQPLFAKALIRHGLTSPLDLVLGRVVCCADLVEVVPVAHHLWPFCTLTQQETTFGDYGPGRFAWQLENVRVLPQPITVRGQQGLWNWPVELESLEFNP